MSKVSQRATRKRHTIHSSQGSRHKSGCAGLYTFTPEKTRRGKTAYKEVPALVYYETSSGEEDTPARKRTKVLGQGTGRSNIGGDDVPFTVEDFGEYQEVICGPRRTTKVSTLSSGPIYISYYNKESK